MNTRAAAMVIVLGLTVLLAAPLRAQNAPARGPSDEHVAMPQFPSGWVQQAVQPGALEIVEYIPRDQTSDNWRDKITLEIHHDSNTLPLDAFQRRALALVRENCDGVVEGRLQTGLNNGFPSAFWTLGCKKDKRGNFGDTLYTKAVQGVATMYILTRTWRTAPYVNQAPLIDKQQTDEAVRFLTTAVICSSDPQHPCPNAAKPK